MKFYFLWAKNVNVKSFINLLAYLFFIMNLLFFMASAEARKHRRKSTERFECTSEPMLEEPFDFLTRGRGLFEKVCQCEDDWKDTYCLNLYIYLNMHNAPKICICRFDHFFKLKKFFRKNGENTKTCNQFMTKCFNDGNIKSTRCRCCFNQPDPYCRQLDCKNMHPDFGQNSNTTCMCYDQTDYPRHLCSGYYTAAILPPETTSETFMLTEYIPTTVASASVLSSTTPSIFSTLKEKLDNGVVLALIIVLAAGIGIGVCFGCGVLIFGRVQTNRKRRKKQYQRSIKEHKLLNAQKSEQDVDNFLP